jgi:putative phosphoesterase
MKIALLSDIHGNLPALEAVWTDINKNLPDKIYNLGDSLYGPLWPEETAQFLIENKIESVLGNCDEDLLVQEFKNINFESTFKQLSKSTIEWLRSLKKIIIEDNITAFHASPNHMSQYLIEKLKDGKVEIKLNEEIKKDITGINTKFIACGHSHMARIVSIDNQIIINAGSVGLPSYTDDVPYHSMESFNNLAGYVLIDDNKISLNYISYDNIKSAEQAKKNNRPDWYKWLLTGRRD